jgi:hypothetical protein
MVTKTKDSYEIDAAGLNDENKMWFSPRGMCGHIVDGVSFNIGEGSFVISFDDLKEIVRIAITIRSITC